MRIFLFFICLIFTETTLSQKFSATITGQVLDEEHRPIGAANVIVLGRQSGITTSDSGKFEIIVSANRPFALVFSHTGYYDVQKDFLLSENQREHITVILKKNNQTLQSVILQNDRSRTQAGLVKISPDAAQTLPGPVGGVEGAIKTLVGSNNELTSQYSVRGGNYDENLIYINDFEIYRPYLIRSGQQEGLSFINPELVKNIDFYTGAFPARLGDKMSSALDIQYKTPDQFSGSAYLSLLEQGLSLAGISKSKKLTWLLGARSKTNKSLLSSQEVRGNYIPSASDLQFFAKFQASSKSEVSILAISSGSKFTLIPESAQKSTAVFSPLFTANLGLDIFFDGQEKDKYNNNLLGLSWLQSPSKNLHLKWMASRYSDIEDENFDITGAYLFGERNFDKTQPDFGKIVNPLGAGVFQNYARNHLQIDVYNVSHKGSLRSGKHLLQWGTGVDHTVITDRINQWEYQDSAGYSLPFNSQQVVLSNVIKSKEALTVDKFHGFLQDNVLLSKKPGDVSLQAGVRFNYNTLNKEFLVSPRASLSFRPDWNNDVIFKAAAGVYDQPPFYREMRRPDGSVNTSLKSQKSIQFVGGIDYNISSASRPMRITAEAYYKTIRDVDPYDIDNLQIQYFGENDARAYAVGIETRLFTELVQGAQSWLSVAVGRTMENINNDYYYLYKNAAGEIIKANTADQRVTDSVRKNVGWVRRPSDRLLTVGLFLQDYLTTNKNFKVHLNMIYGSNMSYNIPGNPKYRNALILEPYIRADIGFSALLLSDKNPRRSHSPFRNFKNIWASLEVFNLIDRANVISYSLIKDFNNDVFSIPNRLTPRMLNFKLLARF